jgi:hypothetical protein
VNLESKDELSPTVKHGRGLGWDERNLVKDTEAAGTVNLCAKSKDENQETSQVRR